VNLQHLGLDLAILQTIVQDYLKSSIVKNFDLITCVHTLYHLSPDSWPYVVFGLRRLLRPDGALIFALASNQTILYRPLLCAPDILPQKRLYSEYGLDIFAEDLLAFLTYEELPHTTVAWEAPLWFSTAEVDAALSALRFQQSTPADSLLLQALSFLYRVPIEVLRGAMADDVIQMLEECRRVGGDVMIPMKEVCVRLESLEKSSSPVILH
jgi:SAM-dependent methyltransferase